MGMARLLKRSVVGAGWLLAISASSAVNEAPREGGAVASVSAHLQGVAAQLQRLLEPAPTGSVDSVWLALLAMACMAIVVKRKSGT